MLDQHFKVNHKLYKCLHTAWSPDMYFGDFDMHFREQEPHCNFPITHDNLIIMMSVIKTSNIKLQNEIIRKNEE